MGLVTILLVAAVVAVVGFGVALSVRSKKDFDDQNEVVPGVKSTAPASWAGAHTPEARLHRRLGEAVRSARNNPRYVELGLAEQTKQIEAEALAIDERLVAVSGLADRHRDEAMPKLEAAVEALEDAVAALVTNVSVDDSKELLEQAVSDADIRLQALAEARAEVEKIDRNEPAPEPAQDPEQEPGTEPGTSPG